MIYKAIYHLAPAYLLLLLPITTLSLTECLATPQHPIPYIAQYHLGISNTYLSIKHLI